MKLLSSHFLPLLLVAGTLSIACAQDPREHLIRMLEDQERESVLHSDSLTLFGNLWSESMVINTPGNTAGSVENAKSQLRSGNLNYLSFERDIEQISFHENVAIVMGEERIVPREHQRNAGKQVTRRFINVWQFTNESWSIIGRQATIIKIE